MRRRFSIGAAEPVPGAGPAAHGGLRPGGELCGPGRQHHHRIGLSNDEQAFPKIIAEKYGYELKNLSKSGATSSDLLEVVQASENADALENADLITITIGGNDLMGALYQFLADAYNDANGQISAPPMCRLR